ncbi:MAG: serine/threonine protein kinase [Archangium sp.]|nr:serine/threonine protein kinase [Archangium sp.]
MTHPTRDELEAFRRKTLPDERAQTVASHVASCDSCKHMLEQLASERDDATRTAAEVDSRPGASADDVKTSDGRPVPRVQPESEPDTPGVLARGTVVGRYVVVSELGKGGMGAVYDAWDPVLDRRVALKLILARGSADGSTSATARLEREARALARVSHPNAVAVFDAGRHDRQVFLAMERVEGETLRTWVKAKHDWRQTLDVMSQAGAGLKAVHDAGLVHRDFKPSNVIVTPEGKVKVLDFGLARTSDAASGPPERGGSSDEVSDPSAPMALERASLDSVTEEGSVSGTPGYIAPELFKGGASTPASDQFAFGVALFQALYGRRPFPGRSLSEYYRALKTSPVKESADGNIPAWLWPVVMRTIAPKAEDRFPSMAAVIDALGNDPAKKRRRALIAVLAVLVVALSVVAGRSVEKNPCPSEADEVERLWPRSSRAAFHDQLVADFASSKTRIDHAFGTIDKRVDEWARLTVDTCQTKRSEQSAFQVQRAVCLKRQEQSLRTIIEALQEVEGSVVAKSDDVIDELVENTTCADEAHVARVTADSIAGVSPEVTKLLRKELMSAHAFYLLEKGDRSLEHANKVVGLAHDAGTPGFEGEAWYWIAMIEASRGDQDACRRDFQRAWELALAAGDDENAFYSAAKISIWSTERPELIGQARLMANACQALWIRLGRDPRLELSLLDTQAWIAVADGNDLERLRLRERRAELTKELYGENSREYAASMIKLAAAMWENGRVSESNELELAAVKMLERFKGADDPSLIFRYVSLGGGLDEEGRHAEAIAMLEKALKRARTELEENDSTPAEVMVALADAYEHTDDKRALELAEEGVKWFEQSKDPSSLAGALRTRARALNHNGRSKEALADCRRAKELDAPFMDPQKKIVRAGFVCEAEAQESLDPQAALKAWTAAEAVMPKALLPGTRGRLAFGLARALRLTKAKPEAVREAAERARKEYELLPPYQDRRDAIDAFLAASGTAGR